VAILAVTIFLYKLKTRPTSASNPLVELSTGEKREDAAKPGVQVSEIGDIPVDQTIEQPSGRLKYPDNPEVAESGRTIGEGY